MNEIDMVCDRVKEDLAFVKQHFAFTLVYNSGERKVYNVSKYSDRQVMQTVYQAMQNTEIEKILFHSIVGALNKHEQMD